MLNCGLLHRKQKPLSIFWIIHNAAYSVWRQLWYDLNLLRKKVKKAIIKMREGNKVRIHLAIPLFNIYQNY